MTSSQNSQGMNAGTHDSVRLIAIPILLLVAFLIFIGLYRLLGLPSPDELIKLAETYYSRHGYFVVFIAAIIEGLILVNWYFPGSVVIVLGVTLNTEANLNIYIVISLVTLAFFLDYQINYFLGRYGWYRLFLYFGLRPPLEKMTRRVQKYGLRIILMTYFHPNVGALAATSCGILLLPFRRFIAYSMLAVVFWNALWGVLVYLVGPAILELMNMWIVIVLLIAWALIAICRVVLR